MKMKQTTGTMRSIPLSDSVRSVEPRTIAAVILVVMMAVLWGRVLLRSKAGPVSANAETLTSAEKTQQNHSEPQVRIRMIPLAVVAGRQDTLAADFFRANRSTSQSKEQSVVTSAESQDNQQLLDALSRALTIEAIIKNAQGGAEKVCINGMVVAAGSEIRVNVGKEKYSIKVVTIEPTAVRLTWRTHTITLKMPDSESGL
jgi:hypothetical protein